MHLFQKRMDSRQTYEVAPLTGCMWVAAVTKANDLEQLIIVTDRTTSKNESGDAQHYAMLC